MDTASYFTEIERFDRFTLYGVPTTGYFDVVDVHAIFYGEQREFFSANKAWMISPLLAQNQYPIVVLGPEPEKNSTATAIGLPVYSFQNVTPEVLAGLSLNKSAGGKVVNESVFPNGYTAEVTVTRNSYLL
jgi:hypothetical protein